MDKPGSAIDVYVERLAEVLAQKAASIAALQEQVSTFQTHLKVWPGRSCFARPPTHFEPSYVELNDNL